MEDIQRRRADRWNFLFMAGMWFQDLFNYDFRRTEQCIIPTRRRKARSASARITRASAGEHRRKDGMTATLTKWYEEHGRHEIIAGSKAVNLPSKDHSLVLRADDVNHGLQPDLDKLGIAKTAREEKKRDREKKAKDDEMMKMYREYVLGEKPQPNIVLLTAIAPVVKPAAQEEVGSFGD